VAAYLDRLWWVFELLAHFRVQYFVILSLMALVLTLMRRHRSALVCGAFAASNLFLVTPLYFPSSTEVTASDPRLRIALINVFTANDAYERTRALVREVDPDLFLVLEVDRRWLAELDSLRNDYPHVLFEARSDNFGMALFSRIPFEEARTVILGEAGVPSILARTVVGGQSLTILGTHPVPPGGREGARLRNEQLAAIPPYLAQFEGRVLLLGDLNCTPWSSYFRQLAREAGLRNSASGWGLQPTWPCDLFPLLIPLDHCMYSRGVGILRHEVGAAFGSDHYPLIVDCALVDDE
jgi:endonuclease/exonuclease/phosphatase (EEP) superfamily protein YafD